MRTTLCFTLLAAALAACADSPVGPVPESGLTSPSAAVLGGGGWQTFDLILGASPEQPSEAWGVASVRVGLAPPNPCQPFGRTRVSALSVCLILVNPAYERLDAMTFEVTVPTGTEVFRGYVSAPPNPCNLAVVTGVFPVDLVGASAVALSLETDAGVVVSDPPRGAWPGAAADPLAPCALTVTLG